MHASACDVTGWCMHVLHCTGQCMHVLHCTGQCMHILHTLTALPHEVTSRCMQLLHGLCCFDFILDIPYSSYFALKDNIFHGFLLKTKPLKHPPLTAVVRVMGLYDRFHRHPCWNSPLEENRAIWSSKLMPPTPMTSIWFNRYKNFNVWPIDIESLQNRLLKVCYVPSPSASLPRISFFFSFLFFCCCGHWQY